MSEVSFREAVDAARVLLKYLASRGAQFDEEAMTNTPERFVRALTEIVTQESEMEVRHFETTCDNLVLVKDVFVVSLCPHHILPVLYNVSIGYIARGRVLGLSKLPRLARRLASKCLLQEEYTTQLARVIEEETSALGVGVLVKGEHMCMKIRGVRVTAPVITSAFRGVLLGSQAAREEFLSLVRCQS